MPDASTRYENPIVLVVCYLCLGERITRIRRGIPQPRAHGPCTVLHIVETHLAFRCHLEQLPAAQTTDEAIEIGWFSEDEMPWSELAFRTVEPQVHEMYQWLQKDQFGIRVGFADESASHYKSYMLAES